MNAVLKHAGKAAAGVLPAVLLSGLGLPALGALVFLAVLVLVVTCWVIGSGDRTERVSRILLAGRGDASCLPPGHAAPLCPHPGPAAGPCGGAGQAGRTPAETLAVASVCLLSGLITLPRGVSSSSRTPPGGTQRPSSWRLMARTRPSSRRTMPVTLTEWRGRSVICRPFIAEPPEVAREHVDGDF